MRPTHFTAALLTAASSGFVSIASAQNADVGQKPSIGMSIGTLGIGAEVGVKVVGNFVVRLNGNWADLSFKKVADGADYGGRIRSLSAGLIGDWHPFANGFRLSGGARLLNGEIAAAASGSNIMIGSTTYTPAQYGTLNLSVKNGSPIAPFIGLGYDSAHFKSDSNWFLAFEIGALYTGKPKLGLSASNASPALAADLEIERQKLQNEFGKYARFVPVVQLAAKYRF